MLKYIIVDNIGRIGGVINSMENKRQEFLDRLRKPNPESSAFFGDEELLRREIKDLEKKKINMGKSYKNGELVPAPTNGTMREVVDEAIREAFLH